MRRTVAFALWTIFVWGARVRNAWGDDSLSTGGKVAATLLAASFLAFVALTLAWCRHERHTGVRPCTMYLVGPFAAWTAAVWATRVVAIVARDHAVGFTVVHLVLAAVSVVLAAASVAEVRLQSRQPVRA